MSMTFWIGLATVGIGAAVLLPMMFSAPDEPATVEARSEAGDRRRPQGRRIEPRPVTIHVPETVSIHPAWWERLRGILGLALVTVGLAAAVAVAVGLVVMAVGLTLLS
jgi:hypothetical protein